MSARLENERGSYARDATLHDRGIEPSPPPHRPHPYNRRPSLPITNTDIRISSHDRDDGQSVPRLAPAGPSITIPGISSLGNPWDRSRQRDGYWEELADARPMARTVSGDRGPQFRLPPLHQSLANPAAGNRGSMTRAPHPRQRTDPPSPRSAYSRPPSPRVMPSLRPSYPSHQSDAGRMPSPPLRSVHSYGTPYPLSPESYHPTNGNYNGNGSYSGNRGYPHGNHDLHARSHHSYPSAVRRPEEEKPNPAGAGQSRRLAHLMSEQKRRESINTGFLALRRVVPAAAATDSKAVILRKAASHIAHLESMLRSVPKKKRIAHSTQRDIEMVSDDDSQRPDSGTGADTSPGSGEVKIERDDSDEDNWE